VLPEYVAPGECVYSLTPQMVAHYGKVRSVATPRDLQSEDEARRFLVACRYVLTMSAPTAQHDESPMYPAPLFADRLQPLFISYMEVAGTRYPAVGLFDLKAESEGQP
jgi:hypothetical protein